MALGLISSAYTVPADPTRAAARTVNHPDPAPTSATDFPGVIESRSITRSTCSFLSRSGYSKMERSPEYGVLVGRLPWPVAGACAGGWAVACAPMGLNAVEPARNNRIASAAIGFLESTVIDLSMRH